MKRLQDLERIVSQDQDTLKRFIELDNGWVRMIGHSEESSFWLVQMFRSRFVKIHQELDMMLQQGFFAGIVGSENDRGRIQTWLEEIGEITTEIQLDLIVMIHTGMKVSVLRPFVRWFQNA